MPDNFTTISADYQTKGRGMMDNQWCSDDGKNLLFSVLIIHETLSVEDRFKINEMVSLAITDVLSLYLDSVSIKWPNDILADSKKIAGILIENVIKGTNIQHSIVGVGLNINQRDFYELSAKATSLTLLTGKEWVLDDVLHQIIERFKFYFSSAPYADWHEEYMSRLIGYHNYITYESDERGVFDAKIVAVEPSGHLVLEDKTGHRESYEKKAVRWLDF